MVNDVQKTNSFILYLVVFFSGVSISVTARGVLFAPLPLVSHVPCAEKLRSVGLPETRPLKLLEWWGKHTQFGRIFLCPKGSPFRLPKKRGWIHWDSWGQSEIAGFNQFCFYLCHDYPKLPPPGELFSFSIHESTRLGRKSESWVRLTVIACDLGLRKPSHTVLRLSSHHRYVWMYREIIPKGQGKASFIGTLRKTRVCSLKCRPQPFWTLTFCW